MRLIDADALKEEVNKKKVVGRFNTLLVIDNAPTVDVISNEEGYEMYGKGYLQGYERGKSERPQGEWKVYGRQGDIPITDYCSNCKYEMKWYRNKYKFCPNCGAYMTNRSMEGLGLLHKGEEE